MFTDYLRPPKNIKLISIIYIQYDTCAQKADGRASLIYIVHSSNCYLTHSRFHLNLNAFLISTYIQENKMCPFLSFVSHYCFGLLLLL